MRSALWLAVAALAGDIWANGKGEAMEGGGIVWDAEVDCTGLLCPLPVLRARKRLLALRVGAVLRVIATDPMAAIDLPHFCDQAGHELMATGKDGMAQTYLIRRGPI